MFQTEVMCLSNFVPPSKTDILKSKVLHAAAKLFLERGYAASTVRDIADAAGVNTSAMIRVVKNKENIMCDLVRFVLESQFEATEKMLCGITEDKFLLYAAETTLQLYMAESAEKIRELYNAAYSMPESFAVIMGAITGKLQYIFGDHLPHLAPKDFYELEIATGGVMRGFMTVPCDLYFTIDRKVRRFIECTFRIFCVPQEKIEEAIKFVSQFDYPTIAQNVIDTMLSYLESKT